MMDIERQSYIKLISAMLIFGTIGILRKYIPVSSSILAFLRGLLGALTLFLYTKFTHKSLTKDIDATLLIRLIIIGFMIGVNWVFLFEAYNKTSVSIATLCYYMEPTMVILLSPVLFKESLTVKKGICALLSIIGMILISGVLSNKNIGASNTMGILFGLIAAFLYASVIMMNKSVKTQNTYGLTTIELLSATVVVLPYVLLTENISNISLDLLSIVMILIVGIVHTGIAYILYFSSLKHLKAQSIAIISYIDPVFALILSVFCLHEQMTLLSVIGAVLIIGSAIVSELIKSRD